MVYNNNMDKDFPGFLEVLRKSIRDYQDNWRLFVKIVLRGFLYMFFALLVVGAPAFLMYFLIPGLSRMFLIGILVVIFLIGFNLIQLLMTLAIGVAAVDSSNREENSSASAFGKSWKLLGGYIAVFILQAVLTLSGYFALIIPGIIFNVWFSLAIFTYLVDGKKGIEALIISREYIRNYARVVFFYFFGFGLIIAVLLNVVPSFIFEKLDLDFLSFFYSIFITIVVAPVGLLFSYNIYKALREIKGDLSGLEIAAQRKRKYFSVLLIPVVVIVVVVLLGLNAIRLFNNVWDDIDTHNEWVAPTALEMES